jgi:23S rRNA pseudouridine1911/1915/1917 synthase
MKKITFTIDESLSERLDTYISSKSGFSRSYIQKLIKKGLLLVNSHPEKASYKIRHGDLIELNIPDEPELRLIPEDVPLDVIWEDRYIIVVNKPPGMVVYPALGHKSGTILNALISRCERLASIGAPLRPGVVHRLDKDTSGLIVFAKDDSAYFNLVKQFKEREVVKHYMALVYGNLTRDYGEISIAIGRSMSERKKMSIKTRKGKVAITQFEVVKRFKNASLIKVKPITGRTHQIRVHLAAFGHPILGDRTYGKKTGIKLGQKMINFNRQMLHAYSLKFKHPVTGQPLELIAPMPEDMKKAIEEIQDT